MRRCGFKLCEFYIKIIMGSGLVMRMANCQFIIGAEILLFTLCYISIIILSIILDSFIYIIMCA